MEWNDEAIARLRALWAEGHSTAEIGRRMGVSKNAVVGKAHRLNLSARPSPIRRDPTGASSRRSTPRRVTGPTLPSLASSEMPTPSPLAKPIQPLPQRVVNQGASHHQAAAQGQREHRPEARDYAAAPAVRVVPPRSSRSVACCWPIGEPGTKSFRFCDAEASHGKPYCSEHASLAYVKVRDRREEAA